MYGQWYDRVYVDESTTGTLPNSIGQMSSLLDGNRRECSGGFCYWSSLAGANHQKTWTLFWKPWLMLFRMEWLPQCSTWAILAHTAQVAIYRTLNLQTQRYAGGSLRAAILSLSLLQHWAIYIVSQWSTIWMQYFKRSTLAFEKGEEKATQWKNAFPKSICMFARSAIFRNLP